MKFATGTARVCVIPHASGRPLDAFSGGELRRQTRRGTSSLGTGLGTKIATAGDTRGPAMTYTAVFPQVSGMVGHWTSWLTRPGRP